MNGTEAWEKFRSSGKIEDYLAYSAKSKAPQINSPQMVAMGNTSASSAIGEANMGSMNNMAALAAQMALEKLEDDTIE